MYSNFNKKIKDNLEKSNPYIVDNIREINK